MWVISGLGNPGSQYEDTPHNLGFDVVRALAARHRLEWRPSKQVEAYTAEGCIGATPVKLLLPTTYMNLSGEAIAPFARYYRVPPEHVLVVSDDIALPWGKLRLRPSGSAGTHNGLRSMIQHLGTEGFPRLRIGCAPEGWRGAMRDYVLAKLRGEALELARHMAEIGADAIETVLTLGVAKAQGKVNGYDARKES